MYVSHAFISNSMFVYSSLQYINRDLSEEFYTIDNHPDTLYKKVCYDNVAL